jgi:hypothetical protein
MGRSGMGRSGVGIAKGMVQPRRGASHATVFFENEVGSTKVQHTKR